MRRTALAVTALLAVEATLLAAPGAAVAAARGASPTVAAPAAAKADASSADSVAAALLMARVQNRQIEALSERTATSTTYALPGGDLRTSVYAGPIRTKTDGAWQTIDTSLSDAGASLEPKAAAADIKVSDGGDKALASVTNGRKSFGMGWEKTLPSPEVEGDTASYDIGAGQTLTVTALSQGFSQNVLLERAPDGPLEYRIPMRLEGLRISRADSGHLLLKDGDGKLVGEAPAPMMWDSSRDRASGESRNQAPVETRVETAGDGSQVLVLTPDADYFDRDLTYPVTVDPTSTLAASTDTWVATNYPDSQVSSAELKSGTYDGGTTKARSYLKFDVAALKGKRITDTNLALYSFYSSTCSTAGAGTQVRRITSNWSSSDVTWAAQPTTTATGAVTSTAAKGWNSSCPAGTVNFDVDAIVQAWADGSPNYGVQIAAPDEKDSLTWRRFHSANHVSGDGSTEPHLTVTYNSYPSVPAAQAISPSQVNVYNGSRYVTSLTPVLTAKVTDPDGSKTKAQFEVTANPVHADTTYSYTATSAEVASGSTAKLAIPTAKAFPAGKHLRYRVRAYDGADYGPWSAYTTFVMNTGKPNAPAVTCDAYPENGWTAKADGPVECTLKTDSTDGAGYHWSLDNPALTNTKLDTANGSGGDALKISISPANGWHTLYARTVDSGGNLSAAVTAYSFGVGTDGAAVLSPQDGDSTARRLTLAAKGQPSYTGATWQYRRGEADSWHTVPVTDVTASGDSVASWPVKVTGGSATKLVWNLVSTLSEDGAIQLRAVFTDGTSSGSSQTVDTTLDRDAGSAPTADVGPGTLNQLTGGYTLSGSDAKAFQANVGRTFSSRANSSDAEGQAPVFGPGWTTSVSAEGSTYTQLRRTSATSVELLGADGTSVAFTATSAGGWKPQTGAQALTLTGTLGGAQFTLTDTDGNVAVFAKTTDANPTWTLSSATTAADESTVTVTSEAVTAGGKTLSRPKYVISPTAAVTAATCRSTPQAKGCRVLEFVYASSTTAAGSALGDYKDQVKALKVWATDPGAAASTAETVALYAYEASGRLREAWDPRVSPALKTSYTYDSAGRVATFAEPGVLPWTFTYGKAGSTPTAGSDMLLKASRPGLRAGTNTPSGTAAVSVVYDVPLSGAKAPYRMDGEAVAAWAQDEAPTDATAVFPPDATPASHTGGDLNTGDYARATVTYIDADGAETNTAGPGGAITTTEYDQHGNTVATLTAANRELALGTAGALEPLGLADLGTAERAEQLATVSEYSADGLRLTDVYGPLHQVTLTQEVKGSTSESTLPAGSVAPAREHTSYSYDEKRPATAKVSELVTSVRTGAALTGYAADADVTTSTTEYDWATGQEKATEGGEPSSTVTAYDAAGRVATTRPVGSTGSDAATLKYSYYTADGSGACAGRPEWSGMLCATEPAAAITGGGGNPAEAVTTRYTYDRWGGVATVRESANGATRTTTRETDASGRPAKGAVSGGLGEAAGAATVTYDKDTGLIATQTANGQTISYTYDALGRQTAYADGAGNTVTTEYDALDRVVRTTDSVPSAVTYTYDVADRVKTLTDSVAGTFTASYDADGTTTGETLPGGYRLAVETDPTGDTVAREYSDADGNTVLSDTGETTIQGRQAAHTETNGGTTRTEFGYDTRGRLLKAGAASATGCTVRSYTLDAAANRTSRTVASDDCDSSTDDVVSRTTSYGYDSAHRLSGGTTAYDAFGRTTTNGTANLTYYVNDLVRSETAGAQRRTWSLDAAARIAAVRPASRGDDGTWTDGVVATNHYADGSDNPTWTARSDGGVSRYVSDPLGQLSAVTAAGGGTTLHLLNLHGDVSVTLALDTKAATVHQYDEYGNTENSAVPASAYGWLGGLQRSSDTATGMTLMGVRLYSSDTGRFLSTDPVSGGSCSAYDYACADPVNKSDLSGAMTAGCKSFSKDYKVYEGGVKVQIGTIHMRVQVCVKSSGKIKSSKGTAWGDESGVASKLGWSLSIGNAYESGSGGFYTNWRADGKGQVCFLKHSPLCGYQERYKMTMSYGVKYGPVSGWYKPKWGAKCTNKRCKFRFK
ncbi:DNRLRE domain-containing protein [Streptomyces microflavus]|uniref:DNRLRE domain-containing protein n=1 Tax=Streptomyces microflavus TaxID=1919 RepID=A0ABV1Q7C5_STRMI